MGHIHISTFNGLIDNNEYFLTENSGFSLFNWLGKCWRPIGKQSHMVFCASLGADALAVFRTKEKFSLVDPPIWECMFGIRHCQWVLHRCRSLPTFSWNLKTLFFSLSNNNHHYHRRSDFEKIKQRAPIANYSFIIFK